MEAVQIASGLLELANPLLRLCNHHMTVKGPLSLCSRRTVDVGADLGHDGRAEGHVRHKVAVHDVDLGALVMSHEESYPLEHTWSQSAPWEMVSEHALPSAPKSADKIEGAMIAGGDMLGGCVADKFLIEAVKISGGL